MPGLNILILTLPALSLYITTAMYGSKASKGSSTILCLLEYYEHISLDNVCTEHSFPKL